MAWKSLMDFPNAFRCFAYLTVSSSAPCAKPTACAAIPIRPPSSALSAIFSPCPSSPSRFSTGTTQSFSKISTDGDERCPILSSWRPTRNPANPGSTKNAEIPLPPAAGSVFANTISTPVRHPSFRAVQLVNISVANCSCLYSRRVRTRRRLRQAKRPQRFPRRHASQIFFLLRLGAKQQQRRLHGRIRHADRRRHRRKHTRNFFQHQHIRNGIESRPAPFFRHQHAAAAHLTQLFDGLRRKFLRLLHLLDERAHLRLHELADRIPYQFLVVAERKIHRVVVRAKRSALARKEVRTMLTRPAEKQKASAGQ